MFQCRIETDSIQPAKRIKLSNKVYMYIMYMGVTLQI